MPMLFQLEADSTWGFEDMKDALDAVDAEIMSVCDGEAITAYIPTSNCNVYVRKQKDSPRPFTEDIDSDWEVGWRVHFFVDHTNPNALKDLKRLVVSLATASSSKFVLSFQYEKVYALNDDLGLHLSKDF